MAGCWTDWWTQCKGWCTLLPGDLLRFAEDQPVQYLIYQTLFLFLKFEVNLALGVGPVVADGDAGSPGHHLQHGRLACSFGFSRSGLLNQQLIVYWWWCLVASLVRPVQSCFCWSHPITAVSWVDVAEVTAISFENAIFAAIQISAASARPSLSPSRCRSPSIFLAPYLPVAILTLSGGATAAPTKGVWEAGTLGFTSPEIMAMSLELNLDLAIICE